MPGNDDPLLFLSRILGLPAALPQQQARAEQQRAMLAGAGFTPEQLQAAYPDAPFGGSFPGTKVPILGGILRGVGVTGQLLQTILGDAPTAPRPTEQLSQMMLINRMQEDARKKKARGEYEGDLKDPQARRALEAGAPISTVQKMEHPTTAGGGGEYGRWAEQQKAAGKDDSVEAFERFKVSLRRQPGTTEPKEPAEYHVWKGQQPQGADTSMAAYWRSKGGISAETSGARTDANLRARIALQDFVRTTATKTMRERAPKVRELADQVKEDMAGMDLGPFMGRGHEFWQQGIGGKDPAFAQLRTRMKLLTSQLTFMHTGARMPVQIAEQFDAMLGKGEQDPANMLAALQVISDYAEMVGASSPQPPPPGSTPTTSTTTTTLPAGGDEELERLLDLHGHGPRTP